MSGATKYCQDCGQQLRADARHCDRCGAEQSPPTDAEAAGNPQPQPDRRQRREPRDSDGGITRRQWILGGIVGTVIGGSVLSWAANGVPGLGNDDPTHEGVGEEAWSNRETEQNATAYGHRGDITLAAGQWTAHNVFIETGGRIAAAVTEISGGSLDLYGIKQDQEETFADGGDLSTLYLQEEGVTGQAQVTEQVPSGEYLIIFCNSGVYGSSADDSVEATVVAGVGLF